MSYADTISRYTRLNPVGVEALMRLTYGTLSHLPEETFREEARIAEECERVEAGFLRRVAGSYGLTGEYDAWSREHGEGGA